jgi:glycosyltransferase involved in cell wall biosynthesis
VLFSQEHYTHPIIRRQLVTLGALGCVLTVLDGGSPDDKVPGVQYVARQIRAVSLARLGKLVWKPLQRVAPAAGEGWWTLVHFLQALLTSIRYATAALRVDADYYQAHDLYSLLPALIAGTLRRRRAVYDAHELVSEQGDPRSMRNAFERHLERWLVPRAAVVLVPSASRADVYVRRCGLRAAPTVILNCPPTTDRRPSSILRERLGLAASSRIVLYHGTFMAGRALEELVAAVQYFEPGTVLVLMGEQNEYFERVLKPLSEARDVRGRVFCLPFVDPGQVMDYVSSAHLGIVIYKNINLNNYFCAPTKLYEYLMAGVPVIVSEFPDMVALLAEFPVGRACDPDDPVSIATAINEWLRGSFQEQRSVAEALEDARRTFNWERESQKLLTVFFGVGRGRLTRADAQ